MSCCNQQYRAHLTRSHRLLLRYRCGQPIEIVGPATGTRYAFSRQDPDQLVIPEDAFPMLRRGGLQLVGAVDLHRQDHLSREVDAAPIAATIPATQTSETEPRHSGA